MKFFCDKNLGYKSIVSTMLLFLCSILNAQVYQPAFIISIYGDTIQCQIKHIRFITNKTEYRYKKSLEDKRDFFINSKDVLWIITPEDTFECLAVDKGLSKGQVYAYRLLVNGYLRLYSQDRFSKLPGEAASVFFLKKEGLPLKEINEVDYQKQLANYTTDDPLSKEKTAAAHYNQKEIIDYIKSYNEWHVAAHK